MDALLIRIQGGAATAVAPVAFGPGGGTIGRADTNTLVLSDPERSVSRLHARVEWRDGAPVIVNLGINPVLCNGTVLVTRAEAVLAVGDQLRIGRFTLSVESTLADAIVLPEDPENLEEALFDDMTGLPLPRRERTTAPPAAVPVFADLSEQTVKAHRTALGPATAGAAPPTCVPVRSTSPSAEELWLVALLRGMGCPAPVWPTPLTSAQIEQVGAMLRSAMNETLRAWTPNDANGAQRDWMASFQHNFLRACSAGLGSTPGPGPSMP